VGPTAGLGVVAKRKLPFPSRLYPGEETNTGRPGRRPVTVTTELGRAYVKKSVR